MNTNKSFSTETSERYSRALFEVSTESNEIKKVEDDVKNFYTLYNSSFEIKNFLQNPTHTTDIQKKVINVLTEKLGFTKNLKNFFLLLVEKRRIFFVKKIFDSFLRLCSKKRGEVKASLISSKRLTETELNKINEELSKTIGSTIKFDYKVDEELIGGLKLQLGSFMIDTSIKNKLKKFKQAMLKD
tara:strand:- start:1393 stop:1950 length:558 start_codon:yes stop_codon:yes gene_type:complete